MTPAIKTTSATRVLPADVYDTLELVAEAYGGIGAGSYDVIAVDGDRADYVPCCAHGAGSFACPAKVFTDYGPVRETLYAVGIGEEMNDRAVRAVNKRKGLPGSCSTRVSFAEWCAELNVVRGEAE